MKLVTDNLQLPLPSELLEIIQPLIADREFGCVITFRDSDYRAEAGGFHPIEMYIDEFGELQYITDFAFWGIQPYEELVKELDFDFGLGLFVHNTALGSYESGIAAGRDMFRLWSSNFIGYYTMGVYQVEIQEI